MAEKKIAEDAALIKKLKAENIKLTKQINVLQTQKPKKSDEIKALNKKLQDSVNKLFENNIKLQQKENEIRILKNNVASLEKENEDLKE